VARDIDRDDWRTFRADRIEAPRLTGVRFVPADPPDAAAFVARAVTTAPYRYQARILVQAPADVVAAHVPPTVDVIEPVDADNCVLITGSDSLDALSFHTALLDLDFVVLAPSELVSRLGTLAVRLTAASQASLAREST
jgi:predicted DNA-binding transcriptional regulator YafY